jgi:hypothetical protein
MIPRPKPTRVDRRTSRLLLNQRMAALSTKHDRKADDIAKDISDVEAWIRAHGVKKIPIDAK